MVRCLYVAAISMALANVVSATLYPTWPVSYTVYGAGRQEVVTWTDDGHKPHLGKLGMLDIKLYTADDVCLSTLARNVKPLSRSHAVDIPSILPAGVYTIHIISTSTYSTFYTADFSIKNPTETPVFTQGPTTPSMSSPSGNINPHPFLTLVLPNTTVTSQLSGTTTREAAAGATVYADALPAHANRVYNGADQSSTRRARIDPEKAKFRLAFILWPTLVGISMAL